MIDKQVENNLVNINNEYLAKLHEIEQEVVEKIAANLWVDSQIKSKVIELLGAKLLESRSGQVSLHQCENSFTNEVQIKFKYDR